MGYAPHHRLSAEQAAEAAVSGSSARKAPAGKAWNKADNFCLIVRKHDEARGSQDFGALLILCGICGGFFGGFRGAAFFFAHFFGKRRGDTHFFVRRGYAVGFDRI